MPATQSDMLFLFLLICICSCLVGSSPIYQWKNIVILAGQSNMSGRGGVVNATWDGVIPPECRPNVSVLRLSRNLTWEKAHEPLHVDIDIKKVCGVGPGMSFANAVLRKEPSYGVLGLVPCAVGGTNISKWQRKTHLYDNLVRRTKAALLEGGRVEALLWYQGESDTIDYQDAVSFKGKLEKLITDLRIDLQSPSLPIFQVALASGPGQYTETVRAAQLGIALPNVVTVDAKGLELEADGLHLSTPAQVRLGEMLADAYLQTLPSRLNRTSIDNASSRSLNSNFDFVIFTLVLGSIIFFFCKFNLHKPFVN